MKKYRYLILLASIFVFLAHPSFAHAKTRYLDNLFTQVTTTTDIVYGQAPALPRTLPPYNSGQETLRLDMYQPTGDTEANRIAIIWVHGGSFFFGSKNEFSNSMLTTGFARKGFVTFAIDYRLSDHGTAPSSPDIEYHTQQAKYDILAAVRWVRSHAQEYRIDPDRIVVGGTSAGAWSSLYAAYDTANVGTSGNPNVSSRVAAVVSLAGGMSAADLGLISAGEPPAIFIHGDHDAIVPPNLPRGVYDKLRSLNIPAELHLFPGGHSAFPEGFHFIPTFLYNNLSSPASPSPTPSPNALPGDFNGDGHVNWNDFIKVRDGFGTIYNIFHYNQLVKHYEN